MSKILVYDFWDEKTKREPIGKFNSFDAIKIENKDPKVLSDTNLKDQILILDKHKYRIVSVDSSSKKNTISDHHKTSDEINYEIIVESVER